jgi:hypothetical protein
VGLVLQPSLNDGDYGIAQGFGVPRWTDSPKLANNDRCISG